MLELQEILVLTLFFHPLHLQAVVVVLAVGLMEKMAALVVAAGMPDLLLLVELEIRHQQVHHKVILVELLLA
jgi:hypothetical protein